MKLSSKTLSYYIRHELQARASGEAIDPTEGRGIKTKELLDPQKLINTLILLLLFFLYSCKENRSYNSLQNMTCTEENKNSIEANSQNTDKDDFYLFFNKFKSDSTFQMKSILFPIKIYTVGEDDNKAYVIDKIGKKSYQFLNFSKDSTAYLLEENAYKVAIDFAADSVVYKIVGIDNGIFINYVFKKNNNKTWNLVSIYDFSN